MSQVTVFLRTSLFSYSGPKKHLPSGVMVIDGHVIEQNNSGITVETSRMMDDRGRVLSKLRLHTSTSPALFDLCALLPRDRDTPRPQLIPCSRHVLNTISALTGPILGCS